MLYASAIDRYGRIEMIPDAPLPRLRTVADPVALYRACRDGQTIDARHHDDARAMLAWMRSNGLDVPARMGIDWIPIPANPYYRALHTLPAHTEADVFRAAQDYELRAQTLLSPSVALASFRDASPAWPTLRELATRGHEPTTLRAEERANERAMRRMRNV